MCQNRFRPVIWDLSTPWPIFLKLGPHICPGQHRKPIDPGVTGSKVKVKCVKTISDCLSNNFSKWISSSYICATYFDKYSFTKHQILWHNVLRTSLVKCIVALWCHMFQIFGAVGEHDDWLTIPGAAKDGNVDVSLLLHLDCYYFWGWVIKRNV